MARGQEAELQRQQQATLERQRAENDAMAAIVQNRSHNKVAHITYYLL